jgi:NADH-quinone oxidoreductase subunit M
MLSILIWLPAAAALIGAIAGGERVAGGLTLLGSLGSLALAIVLIGQYNGPSGSLTHVTDVTWIRSLGIHYSIGVNGLNLFLVAMTTVVFSFSLLAANLRSWAKPTMFYLLVGIAESAVLGAFLAQDLALFVAFFDLMLIPFYLITGMWGGPGRVAATMKLVIYTLVGSLLMLAGAVALAVLTAHQSGQPLDFSYAALSASPLGGSTQDWIFVLFAAAFLVKMPAFPLHGWMPDGYREMPLEVLAIFSGVLSKVGAYGFLGIVLPLLPSASVHFQTLMLVIGLASIVYGSAMAFTQTNARLIVGYSSVAQLGFITAGIFALRADGSDGAVLQMVNHGLVVAPIFIMVAILLERTGTEDIREMGGMAMRAPVLAALFLIVVLATLAMPGSSNFVGEFYILNGLFQAKIVFAFIAISGVAMSAYYALRLYQGTMHNRQPSGQNQGLLSREIGWRDGVVLVPLVLCIVALALYPQLILKRSNPSVQQTIAKVTGGSAPNGKLAEK